MTMKPDETHLEPILESILRRLGLTHCPMCYMLMTVVNVGYKSKADFKDVFPIVYIACTRCQKRVKTVQVREFIQSREEVINALKDAS